MRLREDRFNEGGVTDFVYGGVDVVVSGLTAVLFICHKMHAFTRLGAHEYIGEVAKWVHRIFAILSDIL